MQMQRQRSEDRIDEQDLQKVIKVAQDIKKEMSDFTEKEGIKNVKNPNKQSGPQNENEIKELLIGGGAGALAYVSGYTHGLVEIVGKEKLREYEIGCLSAGSIVGLCLHYVLRQDTYDMRFFYNEWIRRCYEKGNKKYFGWFTSGNLLRECSDKLIKLIDENGIEKLDNKIHIAISVVEGLFPKRLMVSHFENADELGQALCSSCGIPYLMNFSFFNRYKNKKTLDGGFTGQIPYKYTNSEKIFINIFPQFTTRWPVTWTQPKNISYLHITEGSGIKFPFDYWLWDENWADEMFLKGILAANQDQERLIKLFGVNLDKKKEQIIHQQTKQEEYLQDVLEPSE